MKKIVSMLLMLTLFAGGCVFTDQQNATYDKTTPESERSTAIVGGISNSDALDLSNQGLEAIPNDVFSKTNLQELNASNNNLTGAVQAEIRHLSNLKVLDLSNNQMTGVPAEIGQLTKLEVLDLSNNQLTGLPYELGNLQNLKTLNISGNDYSKQDLEIITDKLPASVNIIK